MAGENEYSEVIAHKTCDNDLLFLVGIANKGISVGVTLLSKGLLISGNLMSGKEYYSSISESFKNNSTNSELGSAISTYFLETGEAHYAITDENKEIPLNFLHLKNFSVYRDNGSTIDFSGAFFRLKIEEVDGFFIGLKGD